MNDISPPKPRLRQIVRHLGHGGGVEHVALELQRAWLAAGIDSRVLTSSVEETCDLPKADLVAPWIARIAATGRGRYLGRLLVTPAFAITATWWLHRRPADRIVISHGDCLTGDLCVIHAVNKASLLEKRRQGQWRWRLNPTHLWTSLRDSYMIGGLRYRHFVALSTRVRQELRELYAVPEDRITVIPNGVNIERFAPACGDRAGARAEFAIPPEVPLLLFAGHEFARKGLAHVIAALALLPPAVHLLVVGADEPAPYRAAAARAGIAASRVIFAGRRADLARLYPAADAFVLPTSYEAFPLVCMEAMASGLALFATRVGGIEDYLEDGGNGRFITRNAADIAAKLAPVLADPDLCRRMGQAARKTAQAYAWPLIARRYLDLLATLGLAHS